MCTRVLWNPPVELLVGRNQNWPTRTQARLRVFPRGISCNGLTGVNTAEWTSQYGSLVVMSYDVGSLDGVNEVGLAGHRLSLTEADFGARDTSRPSMITGLWLQYYLDNFATVREVVDFHGSTPLQMVPLILPGGKPRNEHVVVEDVTGDSAVIEYIDGRARIYHDPSFTVVTNSPHFREQLAHLKRHKEFGGAALIPDGWLPFDRFTRTAYHLRRLPDPQDEREAVASLLGVMRIADQPFGLGIPGQPGPSVTQWRVIYSWPDGKFYFEDTLKPVIVWTQLAKFRLSAGAAELEFTPNGGPDLAGDVSAAFAVAEPFVFHPSREGSVRRAMRRQRSSGSPAATPTAAITPMNSMA
jgi:penicillin V acylase-like amidase (Ntn superfamily)